MKNIYHEYSGILMKTEEITEKENAEKSRGCTSKITRISVVKCPIVQHLILDYCFDTACFPK